MVVVEKVYISNENINLQKEWTRTDGLNDVVHELKGLISQAVGLPKEGDGMSYEHSICVILLKIGQNAVVEFVIPPPPHQHRGEVCRNLPLFHPDFHYHF